MKRVDFISATHARMNTTLMRTFTIVNNAQSFLTASCVIMVSDVMSALATLLSMMKGNVRSSPSQDVEMSIQTMDSSVTDALTSMVVHLMVDHVRNVIAFQMDASTVLLMRPTHQTDVPRVSPI